MHVTEGVWLCVLVPLGVELSVRDCVTLGVGDGEGLPVVLGVAVAERVCVPLAVCAWLGVPVAVVEGVTLGLAPWLGDCEIVGVEESVPMLPVCVGVIVVDGVLVALGVSEVLCEAVCEMVGDTEALRVDDGVAAELAVGVRDALSVGEGVVDIEGDGSDDAVPV